MNDTSTRLQALPPPRGRVRRFANKGGYATPAGRLPGATTILSATSAGKARVETWLKRPDAPAISAAARARGTWTHDAIEAWIRAHATGTKPPEPTHFAHGGYWRSAKSWLEQHWAQMVELEQPVYHPSGYAGSFDALGYLNFGREPDALTLCDWKTSKHTRTEDLLLDYLHQLGAYAHAIQFVYGVAPERGVLMIARPYGPPDVWEYSRAQLDEATEAFLARVQRYYAMPRDA